DLRARIAVGVGHDAVQIRAAEPLRPVQGEGHQLVVPSGQLLRRQVAHAADGILQRPGSRRVLRRGKTAVGPGEEQVPDDVADIISHGTVKGEFRINDLYALFVGKDGAGVEIPVEQRLGVVHEAVSEPAHLPVKGIIFIEKGPDKVLVPGGNDVAALVVPVGFRQDQILRDVAQLRIGEELHPALFLPAVQHQIRGRQQGLGQEGGDVLRQMAVYPARQQLLAEVPIGGDILHGQSRHGLVIVVDLRDVIRRQPGLQLQGLRLDPAPIDVQRPPGGAQPLVRLLDDDRAAIPQRADPEDVVDVAVADLRTGGLLIRVEPVKNLCRIAL
ncbi:ornithine carbamoyltransferase, partial [Dysosmobacter welbionis]